MSERRWLRTTMRVLASTVTGVGVVALAGAGVAGGILWQAPESTPAPAPAVEVGAASLPLVCPPAPVVPTGDGGDIDYDEAFGTGGAEAELLSRLVVVGRDGPPGEATAGPVGASSPEQLAATGNVRLYGSAEPDPVQLQAQPSGGRTALAAGARSEERRVGKECRSRWATSH